MINPKNLDIEVLASLINKAEKNRTNWIVDELLDDGNSITIMYNIRFRVPYICSLKVYWNYGYTEYMGAYELNELNIMLAKYYECNQADFHIMRFF